MSKTMIITDTCCDLPAALVDNYDVEILSTAFSIDDRVFNEGLDFTCENFYEILPAPKGKIKSASIAAAVYLDRFKNADACGFDSVLVIITASGDFPINRTVDEAVELYKTQNPTSTLRIEVIDTQCFSMCTGLLVLEAAKLAQEKTDFDELIKTIKTDCDRMRMLDNSDRSFDDFYACCAEALYAGKPDYAIGYAVCEKEARATAMLLEEELGYGPLLLYKLGAISAYEAGKETILLCFEAPEGE
ncbi:MAG: DegV family protein [Clostridia bacterium]|nr:DegV family protein [Clostridia bacterium]